MKSLLATAAALSLVATTAAANTALARITKIEPRYQTSYQNVPTTQCQDVQVPVYGTVTREGNAGEGALAGMIIGGLLGKGVTGDDGGAAAGAVIGGVIGADRSGTRTEQVITGYKTERQCSEVLVQQQVQTIKNYRITYRWQGMTGTSYTYNAYNIGDRIPVTVSIVAQ